MRRRLRPATRISLVLALAACAGLGGYLAASSARGPDQPPGLSAVESIVGKKAAAHDLIEGRLTLAGAVEKFRLINQARPGFSWQTLRAAFPGATHEECLGHQVIGYAAEELRDHPEQAEALVTRLNAELAASTASGSVSPG
jgi:hypothetical protein